MKTKTKKKEIVEYFYFDEDNGFIGVSMTPSRNEFVVGHHMLKKRLKGNCNTLLDFAYSIVDHMDEDGYGDWRDNVSSSTLEDMNVLEEELKKVLPIANEEEKEIVEICQDYLRLRPDIEKFLSYHPVPYHIKRGNKVYNLNKKGNIDEWTITNVFMQIEYKDTRWACRCTNNKGHYHDFPATELFVTKDAALESLRSNLRERISTKEAELEELKLKLSKT